MSHPYKCDKCGVLESMPSEHRWYVVTRRAPNSAYNINFDFCSSQCLNSYAAVALKQDLTDKADLEMHLAERTVSRK